MIRFNPDSFEIELVQLKSASTALGGYVRVEDASERTGFRSVPVPAPVVDKFNKLHKTTKYLVSVWTALLRYEGEVVAMERHPLGPMGTLYAENLAGEQVRWTPILERAIPQLSRATEHGLWYTDGQYIYSFEYDNLERAILAGDYLSEDGSFRSLPVDSIDMSKMIDPDTGSLDLTPGVRACVAFVASDKSFGISPPVWSSLANVGEKKLSAGAIMPSVNDPKQFDKVDAALGVNVNFAIVAGKEMSQTFGYHAIEPLNLPRIMLALRTVNVPALPKSVRETYDIGMQFSHAVAWLIGFCMRAPDLNTYRVVRRLMKHLTTIGLFRKCMMEEHSVFVKGYDSHSVPVKTIEEARDAGTIDVAKAMELVQRAGAGSKAANEIRAQIAMQHVVGAME